MPKSFDKILNGVRRSLKGQTNPRTKKPYTDSEIYAIAVAQYKKKYGRAPSREDTLNLLKEIDPKFTILEYSVPIEISEAGRDFIITGTAIDATVSRNNIRYLPEELQKATHSLKGRPILDTHKQDSVKNILGTVSDAWYEKDTKAIKFKGKIMDRDIRNMISDGRVSRVSIGARVQDLEEEEDSDIRTPKGLEFMELSLVPIEGVPNATISQALFEKFNFLEEVERLHGEMVMEDKKIDKMELEKIEKLIDKLETFENYLKEQEKEKSAEEEKKEETPSEAEEAFKKENEELKSKLAEFEKAKKDALVQEVLDVEKKVGIEDTKEELEKLSKETLQVLLEKVKGLKVEEAEEEEKEEPKAEVETEKTEEKTDLIIEKNRDGASIWRMPKNPKER